MTVPTYESGNITVTWNGVDLSTGWAEDTFLDIQPLSARNTHKFSADGQMATSKMANRGASITMTFMQTSETNKEIAKIAEIQDKIGGIIPVAPFEVIDNTGQSVHFVALNAILSEVAGNSFGNAMGEKTWVWTCESYLQAEDVSTITSAISEYLKF